MPTTKLLTQVRDAGFTCRRCGACCSGPENEVMVSPPEIEELLRTTGLSFEEVAVPYPEWIGEGSSRFTFGWVLRRGTDGNCIFLKENRCRVYQNRPHICRTYPFMLDSETLIISECPGCAEGAKTPEAEQIMEDLLRRFSAEELEWKLTKSQYQKYSGKIPSPMVFDSQGGHRYPEPSGE